MNFIIKLDRFISINVYFSLSVSSYTFSLKIMIAITLFIMYSRSRWFIFLIKRNGVVFLNIRAKLQIGLM